MYANKLQIGEKYDLMLDCISNSQTRTQSLQSCKKKCTYECYFITELSQRNVRHIVGLGIVSPFRIWIYIFLNGGRLHSKHFIPTSNLQILTPILK